MATDVQETVQPQEKFQIPTISSRSSTVFSVYMHYQIVVVQSIEMIIFVQYYICFLKKIC